MDHNYPDSQTDDTTVRGSWWLVTVNNYNESELLKAKTQTKWMKSTAGQCEIGLECKTPHFHVLINTDFCRCSQIKEWMPRANIKLKNTKLAIANAKPYVQKEKTYVEGTRWNISFRGMESLSFSQCMLAIAENAWSEDVLKQKIKEEADLALEEKRKMKPIKELYEEEFWESINIICEQDLNLLAIYTAPNYIRAWIKARKTILKVFENERLTTITYSMTPEITYQTVRQNEIINLPT